MTHLKVQPAFPGSKCWRVWQQVLPSFGKANRCASRSLQFAPKPIFETNYSSMKLMIHVHMYCDNTGCGVFKRGGSKLEIFLPSVPPV